MNYLNFFKFFFYISLLILFLPIILIISILVFFYIDKKIFFVQQRVGLNNKIFKCYKFASLMDNKNHTTNTTGLNGRKINFLGTILRKYYLDEMPQFLNLIIGDMNLVGPRPHSIVDHESFKKKIKFYDKRHKVHPGITGLAQVNNCNGEILNTEMLKKRIAYDLLYLKKKSFMFDIKILFQTIKLIFLNKNENK